MSEKSATATLSRTLSDNPAAQKLKDQASRYAHAMVGHAAKTATRKVTDAAGHLNGVAEGGSIGGEALKKMAGGDSPVKAAGGAVAGKVGDSVKSLFGKGKKGGATKTVNIVEEIDIGLPRSTVYEQWTQYNQYPEVTKGVQSAEQKDEHTVEWRAKILWSTRSWTSDITDEVPEQRIAWTSKGSKGTVDGVVTFHELTPDLTKVLLDLRYHPQGLFEKTGNIWRAQGRRARLDLKKFRQHVMAEGQGEGSEDGDQADESQQDDGRRNDREQSGRGQSERGQSERSGSGSGSGSSSGRSDSRRPKSREDEDDKPQRSRRRPARQSARQEQPEDAE